MMFKIPISAIYYLWKKWSRKKVERISVEEAWREFKKKNDLEAKEAEDLLKSHRNKSKE